MSDITKPRVACFMMQRDESDLLRPWITYHAALFGFENLFVYDNGSTSLTVDTDLMEFARKGVRVDRRYHAGADFHGKGDIIGSMIESLGGRYDFYLPLDCDEFFVLRTGEAAIACDPATVNAALGRHLNETRILQVKAAFYNILNNSESFWCWPHQKTFFAGASYKTLDHGFHQGQTKQGGILETDFAHVHYHHKPYDLMVEHSKSKLRPYIDVEDRTALEAYEGINYHCKLPLLQGRETYNERFIGHGGVSLPVFPAFLRSLGLPVPFA